MKLRDFVETLGDDTCRRIHEEYCELEAKGKIGDGALRSTTEYFLKHFADNPDGRFVVGWMDQVAKEVWRRYAIAAWNQRAKPVVKALEWEMRDRWYAEFPQLMAAYTIFFEQGKWWIAEIADAPPFDTDAAAKEYAQEHVNKRVLACLEGYDD